MKDRFLFECTPLGILNETRDEFDKEVVDPSSVMTYRGLRKRDIPSLNGEIEKVQGYLDVLPTFEGKDFLQIVNDDMKEQEMSGHLQGKVKILDIGYGTGAFLLDCHEEWQDKVQLVGYGTDVYTKIPQKHLKAIIPRTDMDLKKAEIELIHGNVIDLRNKLGDNSIDFIVSSMALMYIHYPQWELIKKVYRVLKPNGVALLDYESNTANMLRPILGYLKDQGYIFEINKGGLAFQKTKPDINVPIRTANLDKLHTEFKVFSAK